MRRALSLAALFLTLSLALAACVTGYTPALPSAGNPYGTDALPFPSGTY